MITEDTLASLRDNDERLDNLFVYLDDYCFGGEGDEDDNTLLEALRHNTCVTAVDCDMHLDELGGTLKNFMSGVGQLQNLQRLRCSSSGDYAVTMAALALALQSNQDAAAKQSKLTTLDLANFLLQDPSMDDSDLAPVSYKDFGNALSQHPTLTSFSLGFGFCSSVGLSLPSQPQQEPTQEAHHTLTPLLQSLLTLPKLESVRLDGASFAPRGALTPEGLAFLCGSSAFTTLEIQDFDLSVDYIEAMAKALASNTKLRNLSVTCHDLYGDATKHPAALNLLAQTLRQNLHLEKIQLSWKILCTKGATKNAKMNSNNNCNALMELFQSLEANHTLKKLQIVGDNSLAPTAALQEAFRHMLQHNYGLQTIQIAGLFCNPDWEQEIQLHTRLNGIGRGRLVRNTNSTTRSQWMEVFGQVQDDLSCLFHLLLLNPLLCSTAVPIGQTASV